MPAANRRTANPGRPTGGRPTAGMRLRTGWTQLTGTGAAASIGLALLVGICVFSCVAAPRASLHRRTGALQQLFARMPAAEKSVDASIGFNDLATASYGRVSAADIAAARSELSAHLAGIRLPLAAAGTDWAGLTTAAAPTTAAATSAYLGPRGPQLELVYRDALPRYSRLVAGRLPSAATVRNGTRLLQAAVTTATAARFSLRTGSRLALANGVTLEVTGIVQPRSPASAFWTVDPTVAAPLPVSGGRDVLPYLAGAAFVGPAEIDELQGFGTDDSKTLITWDYPLNLSGVTADQIATLQGQVTSAVSDAGTLVSSTSGNPTDVSIDSGLQADLSAFVATDGVIGTLLSLLFVSLALIGAVVVLLGARLLTEHRDGEFALMRARGAALRQLAGLALRAGAVVVLPATVVAAAIALAVTPGAGELTRPGGWPA